jgi:hypothetical protein
VARKAEPPQQQKNNSPPQPPKPKCEKFWTLSTDQGCQFTSRSWIATVEESGGEGKHGRQRAMDGQRVHRTAMASSQA